MAFFRPMGNDLEGDGDHIKAVCDLIRWYLDVATWVNLVCVFDAIKREQIITGYFKTA